MEEESPNTILKCNLCNEEIGSYCMLSHDSGLLGMMESSVLSLRDHFEKNHGYKNPFPTFTMCTYCHKVSEWIEETNSWKDCEHIKGTFGEKI